MAVIKDKNKGKNAITNYKTLKVFKNLNLPKISFIECKLETGRTHQIRVHLASKNLPIIGDSTYNSRKKIAKNSSPELVKCIREFPRQALHAAHISFCHHKSKEIFEWSVKMPTDMTKLEEHIIAG